MHSKIHQINHYSKMPKGVISILFKIFSWDMIIKNLFYNKLNSMKQSCCNTSELTKLHHLSNFLGGRCPEFPTKPEVAKLLFPFLYLYNIICGIF